jgi:hypothetical protein
MSEHKKVTGHLMYAVKVLDEGKTCLVQADRVVITKEGFAEFQIRGDEDTTIISALFKDYEYFFVESQV